MMALTFLAMVELIQKWWGVKGGVPGGRKYRRTAWNANQYQSCIWNGAGELVTKFREVKDYNKSPIRSMEAKIDLPPMSWKTLP